MIPTIDELTADLEEFNLHVVDPFGYERTHHMHPPAIQWIIKDIHFGKDQTVLDLGAGFTSVALRKYLPDYCRIISCDHDPVWLEAVVAYEASLCLGRTSEDEWRTLESWRHDPCLVDSVIIDQGPEMRHRWLDLPFVAPYVSRMMYVDDWGGQYKKVMHHMLREWGLFVDNKYAETTNESGRRGIAVAYRSQ